MMIAERQPLSTLDPNRSRVQPTRAAKTDHKWLGQRRPKAVQNDNCSFVASYPQLRCTYVTATENCPENDNGVARRAYCGGFPRDKCDNYRRSENPANNRAPLHDINLNQLNVGQNVVVEKSRYFPALCESQCSSDSMGMDTASDSSFRSLASNEVCDNTDDSQLLRSAVPSGKSRNDPKTRLRERHKIDSVCDVLDEYVEDILQFMKLSEVKYAPNADYLARQKEITSSMRVKLIDWLIEVQDEYKLQNETLHLAVCYVDRFLSSMSVTRAKLQLLGTTAMFLAAKFEEIYPPDADEFAYVTADTYSRSEVLLMERLILRVFDCTLSVPTAHQYLTLFCQKSSVDTETRYLSEYLSDIMLLEETYLKYLPSVRAAAAITLALCTTRKLANCIIPNNLNEVIRNTEYARFSLSRSVRESMAEKLAEVYDCVLDLAESHWQENATKRFVHEKHSSTKCNSVSQLTPVHNPKQQVTTKASLSWLNVMSVWTT